MTILFWLSAFLLVYPLLVYPALLILPRGKRRAANASGQSAPPSVSMLLSVFNEKDVIIEKINNFLSLEYPADKLELIVVSDGSDDGTDGLVRGHASERVRLLRQEGRGGKTRALNLAAGRAKGDILFFTDADAMLRGDCLTALTAPFSDPDVGLVSGRSVYLDAHGRETAGSLYRRCEEWLKEREGERYGIAGADGAVYALRRELYTPLPPEIINDLAHPIQVTLAGKRALAEPRALVYEPAGEGKAALSRQTRIMAQSWLVFFRYFRSLATGKHYGFLWQFVSHKVLRWLALPLLVLFTACAPAQPALAAWPGLGAAGGLAFLAWRGEKSGTAGRVCRLFLLQGAAAVTGLFRLCRGESFITWSPRNK